MARAGFTQEEMKYLNSLSSSELDALIMESRGLEDNISVSSRGGGKAGSFNQEQQVPASERSSLDPNLPKEPVEDLTPDKIEEYLNQLENKYLDPTTLEARPEYANGNSPETAIHKAVPGATWQRLKLSFGNKNPEETVKYLEGAYGAGNVKLSKGGNVTVKDKDTNAWYQLDPEGAGQGSMWEKAFERTRDVLADNADIALSVAATAATAGLAAPVAAGATAARVAGTAALVGAKGGAVSGMSRVLLGRLAGTYDATIEDTAKDIAVETLLSAGGNAFVPGVKYGAKQLGGMFKKTAEVTKAAPEATRTMWKKALSISGGQPEEIVDHWISNPDKVGAQIAKWGDDVEGALNKSIANTKVLASEIIKARNKFGQTIYGNFGKEAGENFTPWVGKVFTSKNVANEINLVKDGVLKWDGIKGRLSIGSADDMLKANPVTGNVFMEKENLKVLEPIVKLVNDWNKLKPASGEDGAKQFLTFKTRLAESVRKAEAVALAPGKNMGDALRQVKEFQSQLKTQFLQKAVDPAKAPELASKLAAIDMEYKNLKDVIAPVEEAVRKSAREGSPLEPFRRLYEDVIHKNQLGTKKALSKNQMQQTISKLAEYANKVDSKVIDDALPEGKMDLADIFETLGLRKAALAAVPWTRGGLDSAFTVGAIVSGNPAVIAASLVRSPKINYNAARVIDYGYRALDNIRKVAPEARKNLLTNAEAAALYFKPIIEAPGLEMQMGIQLGNQLKGGGGGQQ